MVIPIFTGNQLPRTSSKKKGSSASATERDYALMKKLSSFSDDEQGVSPLKRLKVAMAAAGGDYDEYPVKNSVKGICWCIASVGTFSELFRMR